MKTIFLLITFSLCSLGFGQRIDDFKIRISNDSVFTSNTISEPYIVLFFLAQECPFDKVYKERIMKLKKAFPHYFYMTVGNVKLDNIPQFKKNKSLQYTFNVEKTPTVVVIKNLANGFNIIYKGPIDDNAQLPNKVKQHYLHDVLKNPVSQKGEFYTPGCVLH